MEGIRSGGDNRQAKSKESKTHATVNHREGRERRMEKQSNHSIVHLPRNRVLEGGDGGAEEILATPRLDKRWDGVAPQRVEGIEPKRRPRAVVACLTDDGVQADRLVFCRWEGWIIGPLSLLESKTISNIGLIFHECQPAILTRHTTVVLLISHFRTVRDASPNSLISHV